MFNYSWYELIYVAVLLLKKGLSYSKNDLKMFIQPLLIFVIIFFRTKTRQTNLHPLPDFGAGKRVPFQSLPHSKETDRNCSCAVPHWTSDQNLVPKSTHEVEERKQIQTRWWGWIRRFAPRVSVISDSAAMMPYPHPKIVPPNSQSDPHDSTPPHPPQKCFKKTLFCFFFL